MVIIHKNQTPKMPCPGWALPRGGKTYQGHIGKSCAYGVMCCARDLKSKPQWRMTGMIDNKYIYIYINYIYPG